MNPAPIAISVYTRIEHFKQCVEALKKNDLAEKSELFIYSDAAVRDEDKPLVCEVRSFIPTILGFKKVHSIEREKNFGGTGNAFSAYKEITKKYGKSIFLEDDIVTVPGFLTFLNEALEFYRNDERVLSISGYCPPIKIPKGYHQSFFILQRYCGWGCGSFLRTIDVAQKKIKRSEFEKIKNKKIFTVAGTDVLKMIKMEAEGKLDAGDVRCMYYQALNRVYTIYPTRSLVQNIGHDGTGVHCGKSNKFHIDELWGKKRDFGFTKDLQENRSIIKSYRRFRGRGVQERAIGLSKALGIFPLLKALKEKIK